MAFIERKPNRRKSLIAHEELSKTVHNFINREQSIEEVTKALRRGQDLVGKPNGLAPRAVDNAVSTIKEVLTFRLQEAAVDAILKGKRKGQSPALIKRFNTSLSDIQASGFLQDEVDFQDFECLLDNLQGKLDGEKGKMTDRIPWLLSQLSEAGRLTEDTLVSLSGNLLRDMRKSAKVSEKFVQLGGVEVLEKVLRGDPESSTQMLTPYHPELQAVLARILAEVILLADAEVMAKRGARKMAMNFFLSNKGDVNHRMGALAKLSRHSAQSERAVETLFKALDGAMRRHEHALVWAVLKALGGLVSSASCCQLLFSAGYIPLLHRVLEVYSSFGDVLPKALARRDEKLKTVTQTAPEFVSTFKPSAIQKNPETLKEWWLKKSTSLPELPEIGPAPRRPSLAWLSESRSSKETSGFRIVQAAQSSLQDSRNRSSLSSTWSTHTQDDDFFSTNSTLPGFSWLMAEDGATDETHIRSCDRNLIILQVKRLLLNMEKERVKMASVMRR